MGFEPTVPFQGARSISRRKTEGPGEVSMGLIRPVARLANALFQRLSGNFSFIERGSRKPLQIPRFPSIFAVLVENC